MKKALRMIYIVTDMDMITYNTDATIRLTRISQMIEAKILKRLCKHLLKGWHVWRITPST